MDLRKEIYFYANLAAFPATGALNCLYVASATGIIYTWNGSSYVASGPGPVPTGLNYQGLWDANANLPLITSSVGTVGNYYIVGTAGTTNINGINDWGVGDWIVFSSTGVWQKIDNSDAVPATRSITINGTAQNLSADRTFTVTDANLSTSDVTTNDVSTTKHGFAPKAPNDTTKFLRGDGTWAVPAAGSSSGKFGIADSSGTYTYYTTLTLAMAAATSGQTIEMFTDYTETGNVTITLKDGVTLNGNGHTYTHSHSAGNSNTFQNTSGVINFTFANLTVIRSGRTLGTSGDHVLATSVNDSQFFFSGVFMESTYGNAVSLGGTTWLYKPHSGNLYARAYLTAITTQGSIDGFTGQSTSSGHGIIMTGGVANKCTGISISGKGIWGTGTNCQGYSTSSIALDGIFSNSYGNSITDRAADGTSYYNCVLISTSGNGASNGTYRNCTIISSSGWGAYHYINNFDNCHIRSSTNIASGGGYRASFRGCTFLSEWNNAGGHGLDLGADSIVSNCNITVSNTGANCLYKASAVTMKYASNVFAGATTAVNANITQGITNTEDNQGNILI